MKRAIGLALGMFLVSVAASAQSAVSVKIGLSITGPVYYVDGQAYNTQQIFLWPIGSKHTLQFLVSVNPQGTDLPYQASDGDIVRWTFGGWTANNGLLTPNGATDQTITATPTLTSLIGQVATNYRVTIKFYSDLPNSLAPNCGAPGNPVQDVTRYGIVYVNGVCYNGTVDVFLPAGVITIDAFPYPGYVFAGWYIPGYPTNSYLGQVNITYAMTIAANFQPGKRVAFRSNPPGLSIYVDHTLIPLTPAPPTSILPASSYDPYCDPNYTRLPPNAPLWYTPLCTGQFDFLPGSVHTIAAPVSQQDKAAKYWVFKNFSDGLGQNSNYVTDSRLDLVDQVTANFVPGVLSTIITNPGGLQLSVDGRTNWPSYNFIWGEGETHTISAPAMQVDSKGRKWQMMGWSDKGDNSHTLTVPVGSQGLSVAANYKILGQVQVTSNPPGLNLTVDGATCTTPCTFDKPAGSTLAVSVPATVPSTPFSRYDLDSLTGGTGTSTTVTFTQDVQTVAANYHASFLLVTNTTPAGAATYKFSPPSPDSFFPDGTQLTITAVAKGGYKFIRWNGDLSGTFTSGTVTMSGPRDITAILGVVPFIPAAGIKNAAGDTPDGSVAPGSVISIYGSSLADSLQIGPANPLAQSIGDVTVTLNDRILPLMFVSPEQINAQMFSDLADGDYTLVAHRVGQPDVKGQFTIHRDAPALFTQAASDGTLQVVALHADGSAVSMDKPAQGGETITVFGTGFGPYDQPVVDGFAISGPGIWNVVDSVSVVVGSQVVQPDSARAAAGMIGITTIQLTLPSGMPAGAPLDLAVTVNGKPSATTRLPVQ